MKRILILVALSLFLCSTAGAFQGGGGESTKKGSNKKKAVTKKKPSGTASTTTTRPRPPASPGPTRTQAPATTKAPAADRERQYEAIRIAGIAERTRVAQGMAGEWSDGPSRLTITSEAETKLVDLKQKRADLLVKYTEDWPEVREIDEQIALNGSRFSAVYVSGATNMLGELLPQSLRGELLPDNQLRLVNNSYGKLVNPRYYYGGDFDQKAWIELGADGSSLIARFSEAKGGRSLLMKRIAGNAASRVPEAATVTSPPTPMPRTRTGQAGIEFVLIPAGEFMMGSATNGQPDETPVHRVAISQPFYMGKYEVTQAQWQSVMGNNPSYFKNCDSCPVESVSWSDAQEFLTKLNQRNDGFHYRLPSEAEWEYACRARTTGDHAGDVDSMAWYEQNSGNKTHPVGSKQANAWGLYDMHGNVWEWCQDWLDQNYYRNSPSSDPQGPNSGQTRGLRGGSWDNDATLTRSAIRYWLTPDDRRNRYGFRVVAVR